ncbi:MAG: U32 family peptidase, partial [Undibacterium sp.]|nr:U32 family peptidase [Opitutaceae bacterium]
MPAVSPIDPISAPAPALGPPRLPARPELLAPAGDWECARAAVENGADAIYFGLERFNARMRAKNFTQADLPALMEFLHRRGVRGYVTFNTLVFTSELADAEDYLRAIIAAGVDAAIVQDVGICRLIRALSPNFPIHTSTQLTVTSAAGVDFARDLGAQLVVLARENSIAEIEKIQLAQSETSPFGAGSPYPASSSPLPLEVFVHGALCVAYSGQCLTSESLGGRSANRGECAQACRLPYDLISDGQKVDLGDRRYLLSPQDLAGLDVLPDLVRAGVASLKIEGRLKSAEYVASITRVYRQALDKICGGQSPELSAKNKSFAAPSPPTLDSQLSALSPSADSSAHYELQMAFSRGQYTGWFRGINNQELAHGRFGTKRGVFLGAITRVSGESITFRPAAPVKPGDGIVFDAGNPAEREEGGRIYQVEPARDASGDTMLRFGHGDINWSRVRAGQRVWKTNDPALDRDLRATFEGEKIRFQRPITLEVHGHAGTPLTLIARDAHGHVAQNTSTILLAPADKQPLTTERLRDQLGRLGGTPFSLGELHNRLEGDVILPVSELNRLRRELAASLEQLATQPPRWQLSSGTSVLSTFNLQPPTPPSAAPSTPELIIVVRSLEQLDAALTCPGIATVYCEFENPKHYRDAVQKFRTWQAESVSVSASDSQVSTLSSQLPPPPSAATVWVAPPRITTPGGEWIFKQVPP